MASELQIDKQLEDPISPYELLNAQLDNYKKYNESLWDRLITEREFDVARLECKLAQRKDNSPKILCYNFDETHKTLANLIKVISAQTEYWYRDTVDPNEKYFKPFETTHRQGSILFDSHSVQLAEKTIKYKPGFGVLYGINVSDDQKQTESKKLNLVQGKRTNKRKEYLVHAEGLFAYIQLINFYRSIGMGPPHVNFSLDGYEIRSRVAPGKIFTPCLCRLPGDCASKIHLKSATSGMENFITPAVLIR